MRRFTMLILLLFGFFTLGGCSVIEDTLDPFDSDNQNSPQVKTEDEKTTVEEDGTSDESVDDDPTSEDDAQSEDNTTDDNEDVAEQGDNDTNNDTSDDSTDIIDADELHLSFSSHELSNNQLHMTVRLQNNTGGTIEAINNANIVARISSGDLALDAYFPSINLNSPIPDGMSRSVVLTFNSDTYDYQIFNTTGSVSLNHEFGYDPVFSD